MSDRHMNFEQSELIFREGDAGDALYVITTGSVQIYHDSATGPVIIATLGAGEFFGEMALADNEPRSATAVTLQDSTLLRYESSDLDELVTTNPGIGVRIIEVLAQRLRKMNQAFAQLIGELRQY